MKTIRTITLIISAFTVLLTTAGCNGEKPFRCPEITPPKDLSPIDWENYNDVYTVFWNYYTRCESKKAPTEGQTIKVRGWLRFCPFAVDDRLTHFHITVGPDAPFSELLFFFQGSSLRIRTMPDVVESLKRKTENNELDLTKECYLSGKLFIEGFPTNDCCYAWPEIILSNIDDIYFE